MSTQRVTLSELRVGDEVITPHGTGQVLSIKGSMFSPGMAAMTLLCDEDDDHEATRATPPLAWTSVVERISK